MFKFLYLQVYFLAAPLTLMGSSTAWNRQFQVSFGVTDYGLHKGAKDILKCCLFVFNALFVIKTDQFLNGKVMEATPAYPSTGNPEPDS